MCFSVPLTLLGHLSHSRPSKRYKPPACWMPHPALCTVRAQAEFSWAVSACQFSDMAAVHQALLPHLLRCIRDVPAWSLPRLASGLATSGLLQENTELCGLVARHVSDLAGWRGIMLGKRSNFAVRFVAKQSSCTYTLDMAVVSASVSVSVSVASSHSPVSPD